MNLHLQSLNTSWDAPDPMHTLDDISLEKITSNMERLISRGLTITETPLAFWGVAHNEFLKLKLEGLMNENGVLYDVKGILEGVLVDGKL